MSFTSSLYKCMAAINGGIKTIQEMYNGQEAVIICCSDAGSPLKSEPALTGTVCLS